MENDEISITAKQARGFLQMLKAFDDELFLDSEPLILFSSFRVRYCLYISYYYSLHWVDI